MLNNVLQAPHCRAKVLLWAVSTVGDVRCVDTASLSQRLTLCTAMHRTPSCPASSFGTRGTRSPVLLLKPDPFNT
jgi:hypothetical protein